MRLPSNGKQFSNNFPNIDNEQDVCFAKHLYVTKSLFPSCLSIPCRRAVYLSLYLLIPVLFGLRPSLAWQFVCPACDNRIAKVLAVVFACSVGLSGFPQGCGIQPCVSIHQIVQTFLRCKCTVKVHGMVKLGDHFFRPKQLFFRPNPKFPPLFQALNVKIIFPVLSTFCRTLSFYLLVHCSSRNVRSQLIMQARTNDNNQDPLIAFFIQYK